VVPSNNWLSVEAVQKEVETGELSQWAGTIREKTLRKTSKIEICGFSEEKQCQVMNSGVLIPV
jgi:hypothetical protein